MLLVQGGPVSLDLTNACETDGLLRARNITGVNRYNAARAGALPRATP